MSQRHPLAVCLATAAASIVALASAPPVAAQESQAALEEITVTATRRDAVSLQEAPVSVTAVTSAQISNLLPRDVSDLSALVPNFSASRITAFNAASFAMRGAGQTDIIVYAEPPVAVLVDDFIVPSVQTQLLDTFDLESVEVLRGPQGTLFGKNTTAGAVVARTKRPSVTEASGEAQIGFGSFNRVEAKAGINLPVVTDTFGLRFVGSYTKTDGYYKLGAAYGPTRTALDFLAPMNPLAGYSGLSGRSSGERAGGVDVINGRVKALWQISDNFSALAQLEALRDRSDAVPSVNDTPAEPGCVPRFLGATGPAPANACRFLWNSLGLTRFTAGDPLDQAASSNRNDIGLRMGRGQVIDVDGAYLNLQWDINDSLTFYSVTGNREQKSRLPNTYTGDVPVSPTFGTVSLFDATRDDNRKTFQQEFRLNYTTDRTSWVFGALYADDDTKFCVLQVLGFLDMNGFGLAGFDFAGLGAAPDLYNRNPQVLCNQQESKTTAGYADVTWDVTDRFQLGAGLRYTRDEKDWTGRNQVFIQFLQGPFNPAFTIAQLGEPLAAADWARFPMGVVRDSESWSEPTYRLTGSYKLTDDVNLYGTYSRGFKGGFYNDQTGTTGAPLVGNPALYAPVDPEFADSFELGLKSELFDNRLRLNLAAFYVEYSDAQRAIVTTTANFQETRFFNAAKVEVKGLELEAAAAVTDRLTVGLALGYQDGDYSEFTADANLNGVISANEDFSGQPLARTPELMGSISINYQHPVGDWGKLNWNALFQHEDESLFILSDLGPQFNGNLDKRDLLSANVRLSSNDDRWSVTAYAKNITDERYRVAVQPVAALWTHAQFGEPRSYGVNFGLKFGTGRPSPRAPLDSDGDGVPDDMDKCPGTPPGTRVDASGCPIVLDSDGDGVLDNADRCPGTPAGVRVDASGCPLDSDGDGVADYLDKCPNTPAGVKVGADGCPLDTDGDGVADYLDKCPDTPKGDRVDFNGCSFTTELRLPGVVFETDSAELRMESNAVLDGAAATLKRYPDLVVEVAGHTDSVGSDAYNRGLSQRRAEAVLAYLKNAGVTNTLTARGYGERQPVASNATAEGRAQNRRVVLRIVK